MYKQVKNEQWTVDELKSKTGNKEISKPQFQRKKKWDILPKNDNKANEKAYIQFLYDTENSVHAITFGQDTTSQNIRQFHNIDGNNRINAIIHYTDKPFEIFKEYLKDLFDFIKELPYSQEDKKTLENIFCELSYSEIINFKYNHYFNNKGYDELYLKIKGDRDEFEKIIEEIQTKLKIKGVRDFQSHVKINVNIFEGYSTDELCKIFEDINKYSSRLTPTELLACELFKVNDFVIKDKLFETELKTHIKAYYISKADGEVLMCYNYDTEYKINAYDFTVGFQNQCHLLYPNFIDTTDASDGTSLNFKLWKASFGSYTADTFNTENVNEFIDNIKYSCKLFNQAIESIFDDKINDKLFNKSCKGTISRLKKNNTFLILSSIIGNRKKNKPEHIIKIELIKCLLYHFMVHDLNSSDLKDDLKNDDSLWHAGGGALIDNKAVHYLKNPENISNKLTKSLFNKLLSQLFIESNNPCEKKLGNGKKDNKRRKLKLYQQILMFYYYKEKMPCNLLNNEFSIEHICPNSSEWDGCLDKDRTGNLIPILSKINCARQNKHINCYSKTQEGKQFFEFLKDIIPQCHVYDKIVSHDKNPVIINIDLYNNMCAENEEKYKQNFIDCIFKNK